MRRMTLPASFLPAGYPLLHMSVPKQAPDESVDPMWYAASYIRRMMSRIAANPIVAKKVGHAIPINTVSTPSTSSVQKTGNSAFRLRKRSRTTPSFLHSPLSRLAVAASKSEPCIHLFGNTRRVYGAASPTKCQQRDQDAYAHRLQVQIFFQGGGTVWA